MDHSIHESHIFRKLETVFREKTALLLEGVSKLEDKIALFKTAEKDMQDNLNEIEQKRNDIIQKIQAPIQKEIDKINSCYERQTGPLKAEKAKVAAMLSEVQRVVNMDFPGIWSLSKTEFLRKFVHLNQEYDTFAKYPLPEIAKLNVEFSR
jgi:seryl-tRNA synthetase